MTPPKTLDERKTTPIPGNDSHRRKCSLDGDKIEEPNLGIYYLTPEAMVEFEKLQKAFDGVAEELGLHTEEEVMEYSVKICKEIRQELYAKLEFQ